MDEVVPVNVFRYLDFRLLLRDLYAHRKQHEYGFSHRSFSRRAGLRSTNFLKLVMDAKRNVSARVALRFAEALGLDAQETEYFCELAVYTQARTGPERTRAYARLSSLKPQRALRELDAHHTAYHSSWYMPAIREL